MKKRKRKKRSEKKKSPDRNSTSGVELCFVPVEMRPRDLGTNLPRFSHLDLSRVVSCAERAEMK